LPLIQGIALIFCVLMLTITVIVDVLYAVLNPRMRNL
jgi:dipeptide transport system permease protein